MNLNKKGLGGIIKFILVFGIIAILGIFVGLFSKNVANELVVEAHDQMIDQANNLNLDIEIKQAVDSAEVKMLGYDMNLDTFFTIMWLVAFIGSILFSFITIPLPKYNLFTLLFIGLLFILFIFDILAQIMNYLFENLITGVFTASETNLPTFIYFIENKWEINTVWIIICIVVNQLKTVSKFVYEKLFTELVE